MMFHKHHKSGFSLIILSFLLVIASLLIILAMPNDSDKLAVDVKKTSAKLQKITDALNIYYETNNRLPCPAKFTILQGGTNFGSANCTCGSGIICPTTSGLGNLLAGAVPVKSLGLSDDFATDEWDRRITYAMDNSNPAQPLIVKNLNSKLDVNNKGNQPIAFFFSHGPNGKGAYLNSGMIDSKSPCSGASAAEESPASEIENCDSTVALTADRNFIKSAWDLNRPFDDLTGVIYKKSWIGFKDNGYQWLLFQTQKDGSLATLESATNSSSNNLWKTIFTYLGVTTAMGPVSCNLADNGKTVCVVIGDKYINSLVSTGCSLITGGCATYWVFTAEPDIGFINKSNITGFQAIGNFTNFNSSLLGSKPKVKCWKAAPTRFLCMAASDSYYKIFSIDSETGMNEISTAAASPGGIFNGKNFWGGLLTLDTAGFDCAPSGNAANDFICLAAGQGGSFLSFKLNETTGITNKTGMGCYTGGSLTNSVVPCTDLTCGGQARDVSCNMVANSTSQAACVAIYNKSPGLSTCGSIAGRAARLFIATTSAANPTLCPTPSTNTTNTCLVSPAASAGDNLKAQDATTTFTNLNMGDVLNFTCNPNNNNFGCFISGVGTGLTAAGYIGLYNFTSAAFTANATQSFQPSGGVYMPSCTSLEEKKYYCLYSGTGSGAGCTSGINNCNYSLWNNYQNKLNSGSYSAWPVDTSWSYFSIAK